MPLVGLQLGVASAAFVGQDSWQDVPNWNFQFNVLIFDGVKLSQVI